ncbi:MAG: haloacid dehalogenase-like hydrolase [Puniceicoccales bacterium]|nr:haloacid dehalogenase-like hydrolase [Puniceicoccales bacterium]
MSRKRIVIGHDNVIACIWDFDKTLTPCYMQEVLFEEYGVDLKQFWQEVNALPEAYAKHGISVSVDSIAMNHMLTYVKSGLLRGLTNRKLFEIGSKIKFFDGLPEFFEKIKNFIGGEERNQRYRITLEHYIISSGLAEVIRGSSIAKYVNGIYACELIEDPLPPNFLRDGVEYKSGGEIQQIGRMIDNTQKTRCIFEINKGCNKDPSININSAISCADRRIIMENMIYIADGPSDIPAFTVVRHEGGYAYAVYNENSEAEFAQNDKMLTDNRIDAYGPANYTDNSPTVRWIRMKLTQICDRIAQKTEALMRSVIGAPPVHIHED